MCDTCDDHGWDPRTRPRCAADLFGLDYIPSAIGGGMMMALFVEDDQLWHVVQVFSAYWLTDLARVAATALERQQQGEY